MFSMRKRFISLLLIFCMVFSTLPVSALAAEEPNRRTAASVSNPFNDVAGSAWYYDAVLYAYANSFFSGTTPNLFEPDGSMTRAMFVTVLGRMAGVDTAAYQNDTPFADVAAGTYYAPYVAWAAKHGIAQGTGGGKFSPNDKVTRQQMAVFFVKYFENFGVDYTTGQNITGEPADLDGVAGWAKDAVLKLWRVGLLNGDGKSFNPASSATRAECAMICYRADQAVKVWYGEPNKANPTNPTSPTNPTTPDKTTTPSTGGGGGGHSGGGSSSGGNYAVRFYDGDRLIDTLYAKRGEALGEVPAVSKSSKQGGILQGYFTDKACTQPFYAENPVTANMDVYAKYASMGEAEEITIDSFARMDEPGNVSFIIKRLSGNVTPNNAVELLVKDGSNPVELAVRANGDGAYTVYAPAGFNAGCSYELNLAEGWCFVNSDYPDVDTIRTAAFSIHMDEVDNLKMNSNIKYIKDTDDIDYLVDGADYEALTMDMDLSSGGSFNYDDQYGALNEGDFICIYVGTHPDEREFDADMLDPAIYVKVGDINGNTISFVPLSEGDQWQLYDLPDNFPFVLDRQYWNDTYALRLDTLDTAVYEMMTADGEGTLQNAEAKINRGDFVSLYVDAEAIDSEDDVYFARITNYDPTNGIITFSQCSAEDIEESSNLYKKLNIKNTDLLEPAEVAEIERIVQAQVDDSDFGVEAAYLLADMVTQTDGFRSNMDVRDILLTGENGQPLSDDEIRLLAAGGAFELEDDDDDDGVEVKARVVTDRDKLHFGDKGVQLALDVSAKFKVEGKDDGEIHIELSATFVQELAVDPSIKGEVVYDKILDVIPFPTGVQVNAIVDVKSYTAMSLAARFYTVAAEDKSLWEKFKDFAKDPSDLGDIPGIPNEITNGVKTVGDAIKKIEETKEKIDKALEDTNKLESDLNDLWTLVERFSQDGLTRESYEQACETLGQTNVAGELMDMLHLSQDAISTEYYNGLNELMDKYSEMLEKETDWVQLVDQKMFDYSVGPKALIIGIQGNFVVRADMNIAIGSNLEYEVGKRYNFWFRVGLFKPTSGSSTMDLIDERFAYQFYVMGKLGVKAGVRLKLYAAIGSVDAVSVGLTTELGPYLKLWGFFIYDYSKLRPSNTQGWIRKEQMAGAMCLEFGLYLMVGMEAKALFLDVDHDFVDEEFPLVNAGDAIFNYDMAYEPLDESDEIVVYNDGTARLQPGCAVSMMLPRETWALRYINLTNGAQGTHNLGFDDYYFQVSNPNFRIDSVNNRPVISVVNIPQNVRMMQSDLTITYKHNKMAFSTYDMTTTVHLVWTNMTAKEYQQVYSASVVIPDGSGSKKAVWVKRVRKGTPFDLPDDAAIKKLLSWSDAKYIDGGGYNGRQTEGLTIYEDTMFDYDLAHQSYKLTVTGIQGGRGSQTFTAQYGEAFDFSALLKSGESTPGVAYTRFAGLTMNGANLDLSRPVTGSFAEAVQASNNATAQAEYVDDSVTATFTFVGLTQDDTPVKGTVDDIEVVLRRGARPNTTEVFAAARNAGLNITGFNPNIGAIEGDTIYQVICGNDSPINPPDDPDDPDNPPVNPDDPDNPPVDPDDPDNPPVDPDDPDNPQIIEINLWNGTRNVRTMSKAVGGLLGNLISQSRTGYIFEGWFTSREFTSQVNESTVVTSSMRNLYAKMTPIQSTVTFNANGGMLVEGDPRSITVEYDKKYGDNTESWPKAQRNVGEQRYGFAGWFTEPEGGDEVTAETDVKILEDQTLYAHWRELKNIPREVFDFGMKETHYQYWVDYVWKAEYEFKPEEGETYTQDSFTLEYVRVSDGDLAENLAFAEDDVKYAGTYNVRVHRDEDETYAQFDQTYTDVMIIPKAKLDLSNMEISILSEEKGMTFTKIAVKEETIENWNPNTPLTYTVYSGNVNRNKTAKYSNLEDGLIYDLIPGNLNITSVEIGDNVNYENPGPKTLNRQASTDINIDSLSSDKWLNHYNIDWYKPNYNTYTISTAEELAGLSYLTNRAEDLVDFEGKTIVLANDIDLFNTSGSTRSALLPWTPIEGFKGTFDGKGHKISRMYVSVDYIAGLFGTVSGDVIIRNLTLEDSYICRATNDGIIGGIVGYLQSGTIKFENCQSTAYVNTSGNESYLLYPPQANIRFLGGYNEGAVDVDNCVIPDSADCRPLPTPVK